MTASSREAAGIVWVSRHLGCIDSQKKVVDRSARWFKALVRAAGKAKFYSRIGALRGHTIELRLRHLF
jgi:hypothetical protein